MPEVAQQMLSAKAQAERSREWLPGKAALTERIRKLSSKHRDQSGEPE